MSVNLEGVHSDGEGPRPLTPRERSNANLRMWRKGQSGNPNRWTSIPREFRLRLDQLTPHALDFIGDVVLGNVKATAKDRLSASMSVLAYRFGKPTERVESSVIVQQWSDGQVLAQAREVLEGAILAALPAPEGEPEDGGEPQEADEQNPA